MQDFNERLFYSRLGVATMPGDKRLKLSLALAGDLAGKTVIIDPAGENPEFRVADRVVESSLYLTEPLEYEHKADAFVMRLIPQNWIEGGS